MRARSALGCLLVATLACHSPPPPPTGSRVIELKVTEAGFVPSSVQLKVGQPVTFRITRETDATCATDLLIAGTDINVKLPLHQTVQVAYTPVISGRVKYGCAMGMMVSGVMLVE